MKLKEISERAKIITVCVNLKIILLFCMLVFANPIMAITKNDRVMNKKVSLDFQDIEVRAVLQLIADLAGFNLVMSDSVSGNVTLHLKNVPWEEALETILKIKGLSKRQLKDILLVGLSEEMAIRERLQLQAIQQAQDLLPIDSIYISMKYAKASDIAALLKTDKNTLLSPRGSVSVDERTNTLLVQDLKIKLDQVHTLVQRLDVPVKQVLIESRVIFASEDFENALGLKLYTPGLDKLNVNLGVELPSGATQMGQLGLTMARLPKNMLLDLELMALEHEGLARIVANPRLVTSSQQKAYIESGEEIPYQKASASGATAVSFKKAVLRLEVIPQITPDDHVILDLKVNQDSRGQVTNGIPAINTREMHTKVLVANGETLILGGIYQKINAQSRMRVPFLGRLPIVGALFKNKNRSDQRNELLIFVTPKIIQEESQINKSR